MTKPIEMKEGYLLYLDDLDSLELAKNGFYPYETREVELIKHLLDVEDFAADIGAHIGYHTLLMSLHCNRVYSFEPERINFQILKNNIELNEFADNINPWNVAIGNHKG